MNYRETSDTNPGTTVMPRRRHHRSHQGQKKIKDNNNRQVKTSSKTTVKNSGLPNQTVRVSMKYDNEDNSESDHSNEYTSSKLEEVSHRNTSKLRSLLGKKNGRKTGLTEGTTGQIANTDEQDKDKMK